MMTASLKKSNPLEHLARSLLKILLGHLPLQVTDGRVKFSMSQKKISD